MSHSPEEIAEWHKDGVTKTAIKSLEEMLHTAHEELLAAGRVSEDPKVCAASVKITWLEAVLEEFKSGEF